MKVDYGLCDKNLFTFFKETFVRQAIQVFSHCCFFYLLGVGTLVLDARIGLYNDPPSEEAVKLIQGVDDAVKYMQTLVFGIVEKKLLPYVDTPSFKKLTKALNSNDEILRIFVAKKIKEVQEMVKQNNFQENQSKQ